MGRAPSWGALRGGSRAAAPHGSRGPASPASLRLVASLPPPDGAGGFGTEVSRFARLFFRLPLGLFRGRLAVAPQVRRSPFPLRQRACWARRILRLRRSEPSRPNRPQAPRGSLGGRHQPARGRSAPSLQAGAIPRAPAPLTAAARFTPSAYATAGVVSVFLTIATALSSTAPLTRL